VIRAKVGGLTLTWQGGNLTLSGTDAAALEAVELVFSGGIRWFNPVLGGPYRGFEPEDPHQVMDALGKLEREGFAVTIEKADFERRPPAEYPGGHDTRSQSDWLEQSGDPYDDPFPVDPDDEED
jgi:hypothetical protein